MRNYTIKIYTDLNQISPEKWDAAVKSANGSVFYSYWWLHAYTRAAPHESQPYYLVAYQRHRIVGLLPAYLTRRCPRLVAHRKYLVAPQTTLEEPMLLAHSLYSYYGGPIANKNDDELKIEILMAFEDLACELGVEVYGFVNFFQHSKVFLEYFRARQYIGRYLSSTMVLPIQWRDFDSYLGCFRSKRRRAIRGAARKMRRAGLQIDLVNEPPDSALIDDLMKQILHKHGHKDVNLYPRSYLQAISEDMTTGAKYLLVHSPDGKLICFFLVLDDKKRLTPWVAGLDYETLKLYEPYHSAYCWLIEYAIENRYLGIDFGRSAYDFKRRYGCEQQNLSLVLNATRPELMPELDRWSRGLASFEGHASAMLWEVENNSHSNGHHHV